MQADLAALCAPYLPPREDEAKEPAAAAPALPAPPQRTLCQRIDRHLADLFVFVEDPAVPATNNQAERQLRPAVIARKISCGNKTKTGARAWQVLSSLAATCAQRAESFITYLTERLPLAPARPP